MNSVQQCDALRDALELLLLHDVSAAARALAHAQVDVYGMKPWRQELPTVDACGNGIVFKDTRGSRYCVYLPQPGGAHIEVHMGDARNLGPFLTFDVWATDAKQAQELTDQFVKQRSLRDVTLESASLPGVSGWLGLRYSHGRSLD